MYTYVYFAIDKSKIRMIQLHIANSNHGRHLSRESRAFARIQMCNKQSEYSTPLEFIIHSWIDDIGENRK